MRDCMKSLTKVTRGDDTVLCKQHVKLEKKYVLMLVIVFCTAAVFADDLIPSQVNSFMEQVQDAFQGSIVTTILGICFIVVGIVLAATKDSGKAKAGMIAVVAGSAIVIGGPLIVNKVVAAMKS